jgi:hypothetical protein
VLSSKDCNYVNNPLALSQKESLTDVMANNNNNKVYHSDQPQQREQKLPRSERKALERQKKVDRRKQPQVQLHAQAPQNHTSIQLHSNAASQLNATSTADVVLRAIKRAQKNHNHHDLRVIAKFLMEECDVGFAYGYRGSLLARLAVAALRWENHVVAQQAIDIRRLEYRASMLPMESAAILRGLLRTHNDTDAMEILQDELALPLQVGGG